MKGPYDSGLTWPLRGKFGIKLLNQTGNCEHYSDVITFSDGTPQVAGSRASDGENAASWGLPKFISNEILFNHLSVSKR